MLERRIGQRAERATRTTHRRGGGGACLALPFLAIAWTCLAGCGGRMPEDLGPRDGRLLACPSSPNCVSSFETDDVHGIGALRVSGSPRAAWAALVDELAARERVEVIRSGPDHVHAVFTSALMRYRDDVEFLLLVDPAEMAEIAVRSASRVGYGDMDANRKRIESIRRALAEKGVVEPAAGD